MRVTDHEKEVTILVIHREIKAKFYMVPFDFNGFWSSFTPKTRDVGDVTRTRGGSVYCIRQEIEFCVHISVTVEDQCG